MLVVLGGLPGTGKTCIAMLLSRCLSASYFRIDLIEQAIRDTSGLRDVGVTGYAAANVLAEANLKLGQTVVADCVNPVLESRIGWRAVARRAGASLFEVEIICSDKEEHRRRVEQRATDIPGFVLPTWDQVSCHVFEPWTDAHLVIDSARFAVDAAVAIIEAELASKAPEKDEAP